MQMLACGATNDRGKYTPIARRKLFQFLPGSIVHKNINDIKNLHRVASIPLVKGGGVSKNGKQVIEFVIMEVPFSRYPFFHDSDQPAQLL